MVVFVKQKTAYEMLRSLVGSEMCIRDRPYPEPGTRILLTLCLRNSDNAISADLLCVSPQTCLLYTSDAADDLLCVDLGGRRSI